MNENALEKHVFNTYLSASLRRRLDRGGAAGGCLPAGNSQGSGTSGLDQRLLLGRAAIRCAPSRDFFVGSLFAVAALLYLYKGFSKLENYILNLAAILLVGVALFPTEMEGSAGDKFSIHGFCAVAAFACLAVVVWFFAEKTLTLLPPEAKSLASRFRKAYRFVSFIMLASPVTAFVLDSVVGAGTSFIFFIEAAGIWAFAAYWLIKSIELGKSAATQLALEGKVATTPENNLAPSPSPASP